MKYEDLIQTVSEILNNENISKNGLILTYLLDEDKHNKMNEHLYYMSNPNGDGYAKNTEFEVEIEGLLVKFIKK
jgi:hypothetical protein